MRNKVVGAGAIDSPAHQPSLPHGICFDASPPVPTVGAAISRPRVTSSVPHHPGRIRTHALASPRVGERCREARSKGRLIHVCSPLSPFGTALPCLAAGRAKWVSRSPPSLSPSFSLHPSLFPLHSSLKKSLLQNTKIAQKPWS